MTFETLIKFLTIEKNNLNIHSDPWIKSDRDSIRNSCNVFFLCCNFCLCLCQSPDGSTEARYACEGWGLLQFIFLLSFLVFVLSFSFFLSVTCWFHWGLVCLQRLKCVELKPTQLRPPPSHPPTPANNSFFHLYTIFGLCFHNCFWIFFKLQN